MDKQPKSALENFLEDRNLIEERLNSSYDLDELSVERLKQRIKKALHSFNQPSVHVAAFHHELAYLLGLQGRRSAFTHLDLAERSGMDSIAIALSRSHIALMSGLISYAREILMQLRESELPEAAHEILLTNLRQAGMLEELMLFVKDHDYFAREKTAAKILQEHDIRDVELTKRLNTACRVIRGKSSHPIIGQKLFAMEGEGILYRYVIKAPIDDLIEINDSVLDALIEEHEGPLDQLLSITTVPWTPDEDFEREVAYHVSLT